jgi:hypothetical protein
MNSDTHHFIKEEEEEEEEEEVLCTSRLSCRMAACKK